MTNTELIRQEIERRIGAMYNFSAGYSALNVCRELLDFIDSLQQEQPDVDLEMFDKEVTKMWGRCVANPDDTIACLHIDSFIEVTRHFYKLGLNTKKEE